jgi:hypothetical protein
MDDGDRDQLLRLTRDAFMMAISAGFVGKEAFEKASAILDTLSVTRKWQSPLAKCVGRDGNVEPEIAAKLFGAEPSVGNEPMKETRFTDYKPE